MIILRLIRLAISYVSNTTVCVPLHLNISLVNLKERHEYDSNDTVKPSYDS